MLALLAAVAAPFAGWLEEAKMPLPRLPIEVRVEPCGDDTSCVLSNEQRHLILMHPDHGRRVFLHEVGHAFDYEFLTDRDRRWFGEREALASAYSLCAIRRRIKTQAIGWLSMWWPTPREHRRACALLRSAA